MAALILLSTNELKKKQRDHKWKVQSGKNWHTQKSNIKIPRKKYHVLMGFKILSHSNYLKHLKS